MPRILSRSASLHKPQRRSSLRSQTSSQQSMNKSMNALWQMWTGQQQPIATPSVTSTSPSTSSSSSSLAPRDQALPSRRSSNASSQQGGRWMSYSEADEGIWGQFVDTAEAEAEIIRHSKILSKRYSIH
ncbi:hypothetical protein MPSEU_000804900 [Mayamaea pseudoterrestris]|nr:hypothetical protein MPSEU_000804900 [Mayamaea pseudoterrestris]